MSLAAKMYEQFVSRTGGVAGGDTPNWASLPVEQRETWEALEKTATAQVLGVAGAQLAKLAEQSDDEDGSRYLTAGLERAADIVKTWSAGVAW